MPEEHEKQKNAHAAVEQFLVRTTLPIVVGQDEALGIEGCGSLYRDERGSFFITAEHVARELFAPAGRNFAIPLDGGRRTDGPPSPLWRFGRAAVACEKEKDVAVLRLDQGSLVKALDRTDFFRFLGPENLAMEFVPESFIVVGYPLADARQPAVDRITGHAVAIQTRAYTGPPDRVQGVMLGPDDIALEWSDWDANLKGISGAPLWAVLTTPTGALWSSEKALKMVGVQTGVAKGVWIRGTPVRTALAAIAELSRHPAK